MAKTEIINFKADKETKIMLEKWAKEDDRSVASMLRRLIEQEQARRNGQKGGEGC